MNATSRKADTGALLKRIIYRWKILLLCGVLFGGLWCGYKYASFRKESASISSSSQKVESFSSYKAYSDEIERLNGRITSEQKHMQNSILAEIDPDNAPEAVESIVINDDQEKSVSIANSLRTFISSGINWDNAAKAIGANSANAVKELVITDDGYSYNNQQSNEIKLTVFGSNEESAKKLIEFVNNEITTNFSDYIDIENVKDAIIISQFKVSTGADSYLNRWYDSQTATIANLIDRRTKFQTGQATTSNSTNLVMPTFGTKKAIRYFLTGFIAGLIIGAVVAALYLLMKGYVLSEAEIANQFNITLLGKKLTDNDHSEDRFVDHKMASKIYKSKLSENERYQFAINDIANLLNEKTKSVAIVSDLDQHVCDQIVTKLNENNREIKFSNVNILEESPEIQTELSQQTAIVLLAGVELSSYHLLNKILIDSVKSGKPVLGVLIY